MKKLLIILLFTSGKASGQYLTSNQVKQVTSMINIAIAPLKTDIATLKSQVAVLQNNDMVQAAQIKMLQDSINNYKKFIVHDKLIFDSLYHKVTKLSANTYYITNP